MVELTKSTTDKSLEQDGLDYAIRLTPAGKRCQERQRICKDLQNLGGVDVAGGFVFSSAARRAAAIDVMEDRYGCRYFEMVDLPLG